MLISREVFQNASINSQNHIKLIGGIPFNDTFLMIPLKGSSAQVPTSAIYASNLHIHTPVTDQEHCVYPLCPAELLAQFFFFFLGLFQWPGCWVRNPEGCFKRG